MVLKCSSHTCRVFSRISFSSSHSAAFLSSPRSLWLDNSLSSSATSSDWSRLLSAYTHPSRKRKHMYVMTGFVSFLWHGVTLFFYQNDLCTVSEMLGVVQTGVFAAVFEGRIRKVIAGPSGTGGQQGRVEKGSLVVQSHAATIHKIWPTAATLQDIRPNVRKARSLMPLLPL